MYVSRSIPCTNPLLLISLRILNSSLALSLKMAATFISIRPAVVQACASSGHRKPDLDRRKSSSSNWWTPIFGWSSQPDYIDSDNQKADLQGKSEFTDSKPSRPRFAGCLTEDKARQLRLMTMESESFHDTMYHSAIASRLASDFKTRSDL